MFYFGQSYKNNICKIIINNKLVMLKMLFIFVNEFLPVCSSQWNPVHPNWQLHCKIDKKYNMF